MTRKALWLIFFAALILTFGLKVAQLGWFTPRPLLELNHQPALLFFNKSRGCECEMLVYNNANAQMDSWNAPLRVIRIDMERRPDLVQQYKIIRAPSLILLDTAEKIIWRQDESMGDEAPLNLNHLEREIEILIENP
jgi:hypothetical protein